eukprot:maker-scaffold411_size179879-snap-gene-0.27 protein:Tk06324 transcript:maker-scaffold411_size179879-snap-gene-0.27-mRNA-1 annotation:"abc subfamily abcg"
MAQQVQTSEDLHAWSIYRQNLNSDFTDSALGSTEKSAMPYGNFNLRETTMQSILNNPKYGPKSELGSNMYTYLKFGLPRVLPPNHSNGPESNYELNSHSEISSTKNGLHLQLRHISIFKKSIALLENLSIEIKGGEVLGILATGMEGKVLCDYLTCGAMKGCRVQGETILNGIHISPNRLRDRIAHVTDRMSLFPNMTVKQSMLFRSFLNEPGSNSRQKNTRGRVNALIEDLGLAQVKHTRVRNLSASETQRLNVCCHLLLDTDIVVLDEPTKGMDIFDAFFMIEYLRQWASRGRIVMMTIHPPTYEILTMISRIVMISLGKTIYFGKRRELLPYFSFIEYPCPSYKNPSDYYLDLVTLDNLSEDAMLESKQRILQLSEIYQSRSELLSKPGTPTQLPPKIRRSNVALQIFALVMSDLVYLYPYNIISWCKIWLLSLLVSMSYGIVFIGIKWRFWDSSWLEDPTYEQENINDRMGYIHVVTNFALLPVVILLSLHFFRSFVPKQFRVRDRMFNKTSYIFAKGIALTIPTFVTYGGIFAMLLLSGGGISAETTYEFGTVDAIFHSWGRPILLAFLARRSISAKLDIRSNGKTRFCASCCSK